MASWNLSHQCFRKISMTQISFTTAETDESNTKELRLLVLSHQIANFGIPAFYLDSSPDYLPKRLGPVVLVFDIFDKINNFEFPFWGEVDNWEWDASNYFSYEIAEAFSRAYTLYFYYQNLHLRPLYFTSYLLFPQGVSVIESFLFQPVVIRKDNTIYFRTILQGGLECSIIRKPNTVGAYVLVPPYEHPFKVTQISNDSFTVLSIEKKFQTFTTNIPIVNLTNPSTFLPSLFASPQTQPCTNAKFHIQNIGIDEYDLFSFTYDDIYNFFRNRENEKNKPKVFNENQSIVIIEEKEPTVTQILSEQILDKDVRLIISKTLGKEAYFPSKRLDTRCIVANFLSFFRFDFGFSIVEPPRSAYRFLNNTPITYERLGIPDILVSCNGITCKVKADVVIDNWLAERYLPISGEKSCHFVVFSSDKMPDVCVKAFMSHISHMYRMYGFGVLKPFQAGAFHFVPQSKMGSTITSFFKKYSLTEFQQYPVISFIIGPPIHSPDFYPHSILTYIRSDSILSAGEEEMKTLTFVIYSRIRLFSPSATGMINVHPNNSSPFVFGFRYQPPILLPRPFENSTRISFHYAWDLETKKFAIVDDIGSILHVIKIFTVDELSAFIRDCYNLVENNVSKTTLSILAEGISKQFLDECQEKLDPSILILSVYPSPSTQAVLNESIDDDVVVFDSAEQTFSCDEDFIQPISTCYVMSRIQPSYKASIYRGDKGDLLDYVRLMSHLSWLSVKPGQEKRTNSYPPHICVLLRKNECKTIVVSRFEFLPSTEPI